MKPAIAVVVSAAPSSMQRLDLHKHQRYTLRLRGQPLLKCARRCMRACKLRESSYSSVAAAEASAGDPATSAGALAIQRRTHAATTGVIATLPVVPSFTPVLVVGTIPQG